MEGRASLLGLPDDALLCVLSFLGPKDLFLCSCTCRPLRNLCNAHGRAWLPVCERRWGRFTDPKQWGGGRISYSFLHSTLSRWENLIGFWRSVGTAGRSSLALFQWSSHQVLGFKVVPEDDTRGLEDGDGYGVQKIPFLWMGINGDGEVVCYHRPCSGNRDDGDRDGDSPSQNMVLVDVHFVGDHHLVIEEVVQHSVSLKNELAHAVTMAAFGNSHTLDALVISPSSSPPFKDPKKKLASSKASSADEKKGSPPPLLSSSSSSSSRLSSSQSLTSMSSSWLTSSISSSASISSSSQMYNVKSSCSSSSESDSYGCSPPAGSFPYEMYQYLLDRVTTAGSEKGVRKQKRRGKERARAPGRSICEPEHFVKIMHTNPTKSRPLQGLWKGFLDSVGLDFVLVSYDDKEGIICRKVRDLAGPSKCGSVIWTSDSITRIDPPLPVCEQAFYNSRMHIQLPSPSPSSSSSNLSLIHSETRSTPFCEEVVGMLRTSSCDCEPVLSSTDREGRVWLYADGNFGFSHLNSNSIIDFRLLCTDGTH